MEVVFNYADYGLISCKILNDLADFKEVNIFLRDMVPLMGFKNSKVFYERHERIVGKRHYPLKKKLALAFDSVTSLSVKSIRLSAGFGDVYKRSVSLVLYGQLLIK